MPRPAPRPKPAKPAAIARLKNGRSSNALCPAEQHRKKLLAKVHMGKAALSLSEEDYRTTLWQVAKKHSAADATPAELEAVLKVYAKLGWKPRAPAPKSGNRFSGKAAAPVSSRPGVRLVYGLWAELGRLGAIEHADRKALSVFVHRITGVMSPEWLENQNLNKVIEALKAMKARALAKQQEAV